MKVAILSHTRFPIAPPFAGGLEAFTWHLAQGLKRRGVDLALFAGPGSDPDLGAELMDIPEVTISDEARQDISMPPELAVTETIAFAHMLRDVGGREDIDVVHNNSLHYLPIALGPFLPQAVVTSLHTPLHPWLEPALRLNPGSRTVAVSRWIANKWVGVTDATVIHNGVDLDLWQPGPGGDALVWFGRMVPEKAPHIAIDIAKAAGMPLRLAGRIFDRQYFRERIEPELGDGIEYAGHLGPHELRELIGSSAACLVTPAWEEPYGLVAAEAMACGTPVLTLARGGLPEVVHGDGGMVIDPESTVDEAVDRLRSVLAFDRAGVRHHAETYCGIDLMLDRYLDLYESLL